MQLSTNARKQHSGVQVERRRSVRLVPEREASAHRRELPRRILNVCAASALIVVTAPIMLLSAVLVWLSSEGPVIYRQTRVGLDRRGDSPLRRASRRSSDVGGMPFTIYKFRTMRTDAESRSGAVWATNGDQRVTSVGRVLRQYRLDELPQLFNVLRGDMNLVGPRPERPTIFADLRKEISNYQQRQLVRPGITGLAQVSQQYDTCLDDVRSKVRYDLTYIERQSLAEDLRIMLKTAPVVLFRRGGW